MIRINCPNCGLRNAGEFRFGGEYNPRPNSPLDCDAAEWTDYVFMRRNKRDVQKEWWFHRNGCGVWFLAERHTGTNEIMTTYRWRPAATQGEE